MTIPRSNRLMIAALVLGLALLACQRSASAPGTALPGGASLAATASLPATASGVYATAPLGQTSQATTAVPSEMAAPRVPATAVLQATPTLSPGLADMLKFYPLQTGSSWIYTFHFANKQSGASGTALITDTVVETRQLDGYFAARIQRDALAQQGKPSGAAWDAPGQYWIVLSENEVLRLPGKSLDLAELDTLATLEARLPLPQPDCWPSTPGGRKTLLPANDAPYAPGCRLSKAAGAVTVPAGDFYNCFELSEMDGAGHAALIQQYCPGVGLVMAREVGGGGQPGYSLELTGYLRQ